MSNASRLEKAKRNGWRIAILTVLGIVLVVAVMAILVVNGLFKSLEEAPTQDESGPSAESIGSADENGTAASEQTSAARDVNNPVFADGQIDVPAVRGVMVSEETLAEIDAETESVILDAIQENAKTLPDTDGVYSVLLIGIDNRDIPLTERTDCIFLASINQNTNQLILTSFPKNLYVYIPDWGSTNCLHVVNTLGGPELTVKTIEQNFGVTIDAYASINFSSFARAVDAFGGVEMPLSNEELDRIAGIGLIPEETVPGVYRLSGEQTLAYCAGSTNRTSSRFTVIRKFWEQSKKASLSKRYDVAQQTLRDSSTTVTKSQCLKLLLDITDLHKYQMISVSLPKEGLYESRNDSGTTILIADMKANTDYIQKLIYGDSVK